VLDFGLAKRTVQGVAVDTQASTNVLVKTDPGMVMGTVAYMSLSKRAGSKLTRARIFGVWASCSMRWSPAGLRLPGPRRAT
jgi:hypothetical protein